MRQHVIPARGVGDPVKPSPRYVTLHPRRPWTSALRRQVAPRARRWWAWPLVALLFGAAMFGVYGAAWIWIGGGR